MTLCFETSRFDAALFDLDGVVTQTARVHAAAWKEMFDTYLESRGRAEGKTYRPFDKDSDYLAYVDGKPRYEGVVSFLKSRGIELPWGNPADPPGKETVCGLGNHKNELFHQRLQQDGVVVYQTTVNFIHRLKFARIRTAVFSSSKNCGAVLAAAGLEGLFDVKVGGGDAERLSLNGKPAPDVLLEAARQLEAAPENTAVFEDAIAGVQAGRAGNFGWVVGVNRSGPGRRNQAEALRKHGADAVVADLSEIRLEVAGATFRNGVASPWLLVYTHFDPEREKLRESLCALGNGYFTTRGAAPESDADEVHYPGTYLAGGYNRLTSQVNGFSLENESLVNMPNWLCLTFRIDGGPWFRLTEVEVLDYNQTLDLRHGCLHRSIRFRDEEGRVTRLKERRFVSMRDCHLAALQTELVAENWRGALEVRSALDGRVLNDGVTRYHGLRNHHLEPLESLSPEPEVMFLKLRTNQSRIVVAQAARTRLFRNGQPAEGSRNNSLEPGYVGQQCSLAVEAGDSVTIEKTLAMYSSRDNAISEPGLAALKAIRRAGGFEDLMASHVAIWRHLWDRFDIELEMTGRHPGQSPSLILHLHIFHLLQTVSPHTQDLDVGVPARGWTGEAYRGHIFWDDLFIFPFLNLRMPDVTRSLLLYRYRRLGEARHRAARAGFRGVLFPWQSGSDGREETPPVHHNPRSGNWIPDNTWLQRHVNAAVAYNIWLYYQVSGDLEFLISYGAEMIFEIARFWASIAAWNPDIGRYEIRGVMGPDEYHDRYPPDAEKPGLDNNSYTNLMAVWCLWRALDLLDTLPAPNRERLFDLLAITPEEVRQWDDVSRRMRLVMDEDGLIGQFEGYRNLQEFPWRKYREKYIDLYRLDRILEAEGGTVNEYKVSKQADVLMLFYLFSSEELNDLFRRLDYPFRYETIPRNIQYYLDRTSHGSSLSRVAHSWVLARSDRAGSWKLFTEALQSDVSDIQGGTTPEGLHLGAMAGTVDIIQRAYTGIVTRNNTVWFNPQLPSPVARLRFRIHYRNQMLDVEITHAEISVTARPSAAEKIRVGCDGETRELQAGDTWTFHLKPKPAPQISRP